MRAGHDESASGGRMRPISVAPVSHLALLAVCWSASANADGMPVPGAEAFAASPFQTAPTLSPDGHYVAWIEQTDGHVRAVIFDVDAHKTQRVLAPPDRAGITFLQWNSNQTLLIGMSSPKSFNIIAQDATGGEGRVLTKVGRLVAARTSNPDTAVVAVGRDLLEVNTRTTESTLLRAGGEHTLWWVLDRNGRPVAREDWNWQHSEYRVYALEGTGIREILRRDDSERPQLGGVLPGGLEVLLLAANGRNHQAAWALPLDGSPLRLLAEEPGSDITGTISDADTGGVVGVYVSGEETTMHWLDPAAQHRYELLARAFPERMIQPFSWTRDGTRTLVRVSAPSAPPIYYLTDFKTHRADIAAEEFPQLAGATFAEVKQIHYRARDDVEIPAYLTLPPGTTGSVPLIVLPHDGPHTRDYPAFNIYVQFLATRGYAVLQPQFRGSSGFGDAWRDAGDQQWGKRMQDDLTDGVHAMIAQGIADPRRVAIVGLTPYGGYAALAGAAFTPDVYACAVSIDGLADLEQLENNAFSHLLNTNRVSTQQTVVMKQIGSKQEARRASPINAASSVRAAVLLMYGGNPDVSPQQGRSMASALQNAAKGVTVVDLGQGGYWWQQPATRLTVLRELERFLAAHLREPSPSDH